MICFDTVGLVLWPVKIVPDMTYNVFDGTLNLAQSNLSRTVSELSQLIVQISLQRGHFDSKFQVDGVVPTNHFCTVS